MPIRIYNKTNYQLSVPVVSGPAIQPQKYRDYPNVLTEFLNNPAARRLIQKGVIEVRNLDDYDIRFKEEWNLNPQLQLEPYRFWIDASGLLRVKEGAPVSDLDGEVINSTAPPASHASTHVGTGTDAIGTATTMVSGLMAPADKTKLDNLTNGTLLIPVRNETGATILKNKLVAPAGWSTVHNCVLIRLADKDDPAGRPAIGIVFADVLNGANGQALIAGEFGGVDTSAWAVTDQLVLGNNGNFSRPPPDVDPFTGEVQNVGDVLLVDPVDGKIHFLPDGLNPVVASQVFALVGSSGVPSKTNPYVTDVDPRVNPPARSLSVGSINCQYTSVKAAVDAAIAGGASAATPWEVKVEPGTYVEAPMVLQPGIAVISRGNRIDTVFIEASNPAEDLFTCTGGYVAGVRVSGVTDPTKAVFRCATASTKTVLHGVSVRGCSTGIAVQNGAACILTNFSIDLDGAGQAVTTGILIEGADSYCGLVGGFFSVPAAILPLYPGVNPIQTAVYCTGAGAEVYCTGVYFELHHNVATSIGIECDDGAVVHLLSSDINYANVGAYIGSVGVDSTFVIQGSSFHNNTVNGKCDSATGVFLVSAESDGFKWEAVPGSILSGVVQLSSDNTTYLVGRLTYSFVTGNNLNLDDWFHDQSSTGLAWPETPCTKAGGLDVFVPAGHGYVTRHVPNHDTASVEWNDTTLTLSANSTVWIGYDSVAETVAEFFAEPGVTVVLLAKAITDATDVRFLHVAHNLIHDHDTRLHQYLLNTRAIVWSSGLGVSAGSGVREFEVAAGQYYRALELIDYAGSGGDATFSSFYGADGATETASLTQVDITNYDNAGALAAMGAGNFRSDTVYLTSDGRVSVIYGTAEYALQADAEAEATASPPSFIEPSGIPLARLVVEQAAGIVTIIDVRPVANAAAAGGGGAAPTDHSALLNLDKDTHLQYLLASGARAMSGNLNLGGNNISNVGTVGGVDVTAHAVRHQPGGADAVSTGTPVAVQVGAAAAPGAATTLVRSDHQHGVAAGAVGAVGTTNLNGTASTVARSDHVHAGLTRTAGDFGTFALKAVPTGTDVVLIEDSADATNKKYATVSTLPATDADAVHVNVAGEINGVAEKALPVNSDALLIEDSAAGYAKKKALVRNLPFASYASNTTATATVNTASTTDVLMTGMTVTPTAGTYLVLFTGSASPNTNNQTVFFSVYADAAQDATSERRVSRGTQTVRAGFSCVSVVVADGTTVVTGRWRVSGGNADVYQRSLTLIRIA